MFSDYDHIGTGTKKSRHAVILIPKELTDIVHGVCKSCKGSCKVYASPLERTQSSCGSFPMPKNKYEFLDIDRHCNVVNSNVQITCGQQHRLKCELKEEDKKVFFQTLKDAFRSNKMERELYDPFFRGLVFHQWEEYCA